MTDTTDMTDTTGRRRAAVEDLAAAVRLLADVTVALHDLTSRLRAAVDDSPYPGLVQPPVDRRVPEAPMPLNPVIGACSPTRPDVTLHFVDGVITVRYSIRARGEVAVEGVGEAVRFLRFAR